MVTYLSIDLETYCELDLRDVGVYRYAEHESFEILMLAYSVENSSETRSGKVHIIDFASYEYDNWGRNKLADHEQKLDDFMKLLMDPTVVKTAHNASFERTCMAEWFKTTMPPEEWRCTMVDSTRLGLPAALGQVAEVLSLDAQKDKTGTALINFFSKPCKPTKANNGRTRNLPEHDPGKWRQFLEYCRQDVLVEYQIRRKIDSFPVPKFEQDLWTLDQQINDRGVQVDVELMEGAVACDIEAKEKAVERARELTGLENPNSPTQMLGWLQEQGADIQNMQKATIDAALEEYTSGPVHEALKLRQELSKSSIKKYSKMQSMVCNDHRVRGILQFYGASKTGRWAGRGVQVQNLTKNKMSLSRVTDARELIKQHDFDGLDLLFSESHQDILSQLVRTCFVAKPGHKFVVSDFSAIEARVIAWYAKENWRLNVFSTHGKIYEASASQMFNVPIDEIGKGSPLRQKGKVAELALGYQGGPGALQAMGALDMGLEEKELKPLVNAWRKANPNIVKFWYACDAAALEAVKEGYPVTTHGITFRRDKGWLAIDLPSGRSLMYAKPHIVDGAFGDAVAHFGLNAANKWDRVESYGGKWVENIVQATARDILAVSMVRLERAGYPTVMHVHDEVVCEVPETEEDALAIVEDTMALPISWAEGLPLEADGFETNFYKKD
ncbi:DNA polymerase [Planococcus sp. A6]|uniref:DNA polymerase n=1 Tax=Planococcus sp. A6 TaxID=2992760 RepID=UPI00237A0DF2|nr:DNA polymerase [Planococcus sp. A6]MDE0582211.1 DNA polymerase [Planococcus sp. A6]